MKLRGLLSTAASIAVLGLAAFAVLPAEGAPRAQAAGTGGTISPGVPASTSLPVNTTAATEPYVGFNVHVLAKPGGGLTSVSIAPNETGSTLTSGPLSGAAILCATNTLSNVEIVRGCTVVGATPGTTDAGLLSTFVFSAQGNGCLLASLVTVPGSDTLGTYTVNDDLKRSAQTNVVITTTVQVLVGTGTSGDCPGAAQGPVSTPMNTNTPTPTNTPTDTPTNTPGGTAIQPVSTPFGASVGAGGSRPGITLPDTGTGAIGPSRPALAWASGGAAASGYASRIWFALAVSAALALAGGMMLTAPVRRR